MGYPGVRLEADMFGNSGITGITGISTSDMGAFFVLLAAYLFGVMCGLVVAISRAAWAEQRLSRALRQNDKGVGFSPDPPGLLTLGARTVLNMPILGTGFVAELHHEGTDDAAHGNEDLS
jgi:hypothetical protein